MDEQLIRGIRFERRDWTQEKHRWNKTHLFISGRVRTLCGDHPISGRSMASRPRARQLVLDPLTTSNTKDICATCLDKVQEKVSKDLHASNRT